MSLPKFHKTFSFQPGSSRAAFGNIEEYRKGALLIWEVIANFSSGGKNLVSL
jgi:hypothetical protein